MNPTTRCLGVSALAILLGTPLGAHEIKVFSSRYRFPEGQGKATVYLGWGHHVPVDELVDGKSLTRYEAVPPSGPPQPLPKDDLSLQARVLEATAPGVTQVVVDRKVSVHTYVINEDGDKVFRRGPRSAVKDSKVDSAQRSVQCGKALLAVGPPNGAPVRAVGQAIEIVPLSGPADWRAGRDLRVRALQGGKPVAGATVEATFVGARPEGAWPYSAAAAADGTMSVRLTQPGVWAFKVNVREPAAAEAKSDYDFTSYTATLSLEVLP